MDKESKTKNDILYHLAYDAVNQHWLHAEQIRWTILSNFLTGNSIFILAWAAIFSSSLAIRTIPLVLTSLAGCILSAIWIAIEVRSSIFVNQYFALGQYLEEKMLIKKFGVFHRSVALRAAQRNLPEKDIPVVEPKITHDKLLQTENVVEQRLGPTPTHRVVIVVPAVFIVVYILLFIYSVLMMLGLFK